MEKVILISNGDFRSLVGVNCWPKQEETLKRVEQVFAKFGIATVRGNPEDPGFIQCGMANSYGAYSRVR